MILKERATLFISDLHIDSDKPEITRQFLEFIDDLKKSADKLDALYILGDWFESWVGDDDPDESKWACLSAVKELSELGIQCFFMAGNRDFLVGDKFAQACGCEILADPSVIGLYGTKIALMHGDTLCTDDIEYQAFRALSRSSDWQTKISAMPLEQRIQLAAQIREQSKKETGNKSNDIMDVNKKTVLSEFSKLDVDTIIHGHTHRPAIHQIEKNIDTEEEMKFLTRIVLGDWYDQGSILIWGKKNYELKTMVR